MLLSSALASHAQLLEILRANMPVNNDFIGVGEEEYIALMDFVLFILYETFNLV